MIWKILKDPGPPQDGTGRPWIDTGATYDDTNGDINAHLTQLQQQDPHGTCYAAEATTS